MPSISMSDSSAQALAANRFSFQSELPIFSRCCLALFSDGMLLYLPYLVVWFFGQYWFTFKFQSGFRLRVPAQIPPSSTDTPSSTFVQIHPRCYLLHFFGKKLQNQSNSCPRVDSCAMRDRYFSQSLSALIQQDPQKRILHSMPLLAQFLPLRTSCLRYVPSKEAQAAYFYIITLAGILWYILAFSIASLESPFRLSLVPWITIDALLFGFADFLLEEQHSMLVWLFRPKFFCHEPDLSIPRSSRWHQLHAVWSYRFALMQQHPFSSFLEFPHLPRATKFASQADG